MRPLLWVAIATALSSVHLHGHHSIAGVYDSGNRVTIEAVVSDFQFVSPHPFVIVDATDRSGRQQQWRLEMDNRFELASVGMTADSLKRGDRIVVTGIGARDRSRSLYVRRLDRAADGFSYEQVGSSPRVRLPK
jgi:hypothetical protein